MVPPPPPGRGPEGRPPPTPLPQTGGPCPGSPPAAAAACLRATPPQHSPLGPRGWRKACLPRVSCAICPHHRTSHQGCQPAAVRELSFTWAVAGLSSYLSTHHGLWYLLSSSPTSEQWGEGSGLGWGEWGRGAVAGAGRGWREQGKRRKASNEGPGPPGQARPPAHTPQQALTMAAPWRKPPEHCCVQQQQRPQEWGLIPQREAQALRAWTQEHSLEAHL